MQSLWDEQEAARCQGDLALRVYTSRLLGRDTSLVLHGGGNTSVKVRSSNILGIEEDILYIKGSGWDLVTIEEAGFSPVRLSPLLKLVKLESLCDTQMVNELKTQMRCASAPSPSVETLLHALLPYKYVDHTHADAVVTITNTANGLERIQQIYGDKVVIIPYIMPGFDLARSCAQLFSAAETTLGMVLMNHGIFSFGETAQESYERMIQLVSLAEDYLVEQGAWTIPQPAVTVTDKLLGYDLANLRNQVSACAGFPVILTRHGDPKSLAWAQREDIGQVSQQGPATPDHVIRTKRLPLLGRDVQAYAQEYQSYFADQASKAKEKKTMLDRAPRIIIDPELGVCAVARSAREALLAADIYKHTIEIIARSTLLGGYQALPVKDIFDMEYWDLEQAKLRKGDKTPTFKGEIALVTGAASGIGKAVVESLLKRGAAVVGLDIQPLISHSTEQQRPDFLGLVCDVTDDSAVKAAIEQALQTFGGIDMLVLNAGIFPPGVRIADLTKAEWRKVMTLNLDANLTLMRECYPFLKLAPIGGRVVVIGSKNVAAPGFGAAAYSASKAALNQLARVAALEWGQDNIRVNILHPNAVFDTGIWTEEVLQARAKHYGLTVQEYKTSNILQVEVTSRDVAELAAEMCGTLFAKTTGAQVSVDGGNERVI